MKQKHHEPYTVLDAEYRVIETGHTDSRGGQKGILIPALILAALGLAALLFPVAMGVGLAFFVTAGLFFYGVSQSVLFFQAPKESRSGWVLANAIVLLTFSGITLMGAFISGAGTIRMISVVSFFLGLLTASIGLSQMVTAFAVKKKTPGRGWALLGGGLNLALSLFMCISPIVSWFALTTVWGIYLLAAAAALVLTARPDRREAHA